MKLLGLFQNSKKQQDNYITNRDAHGTILKRITKVVRPVTKKLYIALKKWVQPRNYDLVTPDYDFDIIQQAFNCESILRRSRDRYCELIWENGYKFIGKNSKAVHYIQKRMQQIAMVTGTPSEVLLSEIAEQLILFYNVYIVKVRSRASSGGRERITFYGKKLLPVAGYFVLETPAIKAVVDPNTGKLTGYQQAIPWEVPNYYKAEDVIHIYLDRQPEKLFGTPAVVAVLDDMRALRRMEENVEVLVFQHAIPLIQYIVGNDETPEEDGELDSAQANVDNMAAHGMIVTPHNHKMVAIGEARSALRVDLYLEYFKNRIFLGLGHSSISLGQAGASRGAAIALNKSVLGAARRFQRRIQVCVDEFMINELLEEGGFDSFNINNQVKLFISEIDVDDKIRKEFHTLAMFEGNIITEDEARVELGRELMTDKERAKTFWRLIGLPRSVLQAVDEPGLLGPLGKKLFGVSGKAVSQKEEPRNQYGIKKKAGPPANDEGEIVLRDSIKSVVDVQYFVDQYYSLMKSQFDSILEDILDSLEHDGKYAYENSLKMSAETMIDKSGQIIINMYKVVAGDRLSDVSANLKFLHNINIRSVNNFFNDIGDCLKKIGKDKNEIISIFESQKYRIEILANSRIKSVRELLS